MVLEGTAWGSGHCRPLRRQACGRHTMQFQLYESLMTRPEPTQPHRLRYWLPRYPPFSLTWLQIGGSLGPSGSVTSYNSSQNSGKTVYSFTSLL